MTDDIDLTNALRRLAALRPDAPALTAPARSPLSFRALDELRRRTSETLGALGIARGDVVAWCNGDRAQTAAALAVLPDAATIAPLSPAATHDVLHDLVRRLDPKAIVVPSRGESVAEQVADALGVAVLVADDGARREAGVFDLDVRRRAGSLERARRRNAAWAVIGATSGSTGRPKLVPLGHRQLLRTSSRAAALMRMGEGDVSGNVMPLHLTGGLRSAYFQALFCGAATCMLGEADVVGLLAAIDDGAVSYVSASFTIQRELLARLGAGRGAPRGRLRFVRVASGPLGAGEMDRLELALGVPVVTGLASSEAGNLAQQSLDVPRKRGSVGRLLDSEVRLVDARGRVVPPGDVGEIQVRGPQLFDGYVDDDELNVAAFDDGWFRVGDLARFDEDGDLWLAGRVKEVINRGGDKIAPLEIDDALRALPGVADAATFAVPHPRLGEEVAAAVVAVKGVALDEGAVLDAIRARLGARRAPRRVWIVASLPRTDGGKLRRAELPAWVGYVPPASSDDAMPVAASAFETAIAALWSAALGRPGIARDAEFAASGGDDACAERLVAQVAAALGVELPAAALRGEASTVAKMARLVEASRAGGV